MLALSIPTGIIGLWFYSQYAANKEVEEYLKSEKAHPAADRITVKNYELKEVDDANHMRWQLIAETGIMGAASKDVLLKEVTVRYFDGDKVKLRLSAPAGIANEGKHEVKLGSKNGRRVQCEGQDGKAKLDAEKVELTKKNQFLATGGVTITMPGVAQVTGSEATGSLEKDADLKNFKICGNTHALLGHM
ncbi:MAG: LPS export ABC transporter periplasmic protein LptC [Terriglobales bacterium]